MAEDVLKASTFQQGGEREAGWMFEHRRLRRWGFGAILWGAAACIAPASAGAAGFAPPQLFFYPPPYQLADGSLVASPVTVAAAQITTQFPRIREMSGVALLVYWSRLCPTAGRCDFSLIDKVLRYWGARGKKVVLGVATVGFPIKTMHG
ncbi:MAG TPA: hypothetical protein VMU82_09950, partial [Acetobacteraceae bacterium]|nr:hypothetical protein [Acetobacteraceae bacterium]